ncbi:MAG: GNAT family N-acetyltransferase [Flavobacteriales bacterium]|nr:GNAT family N-acetyltransferase [Flavobacteriia bacterium]NCP07116.1 GNAT family N-acetyltransferase [Flavobacteriales bacterium]NCP53403.1 GNAT family N-acetyltransferase [Flavobacteriales bacterium]NCP60177.1 GNAT family N-acetyltransferase [Flavobacteriales bacterium]NCQ14633.1 GNAT family N-acetyltransferase [Flavobacteriales bacterium]
MTFKLCDDCQTFFKVLPLDWQEIILPFWDHLKATTKGYVLVDNNQIIAGGLVFTECPPDMMYAKDEADTWMHNGYLYVGFIYVIEERRHQNLGSVWLQNLKKTHPKQNYWLTIEDLKLDVFYTKNGFKRIKSLHNQGVEEVLYIFNA